MPFWTHFDTGSKPFEAIHTGILFNWSLGQYFGLIFERIFNPIELPPSSAGMASVAVFTHLKANWLPNPEILSQMTWVPLVGSTLASFSQNLGISTVIYILLR